MAETQIKINGWHYINDADDLEKFKEMTVEECEKKGFYTTIYDNLPESYPCFANADLGVRQFDEDEVDIMLAYLDVETIRLMSAVISAKKGV